MHAVLALLVARVLMILLTQQWQHHSVCAARLCLLTWLKMLDNGLAKHGVLRRLALLLLLHPMAQVQQHAGVTTKGISCRFQVAISKALGEPMLRPP